MILSVVIPTMNKIDLLRRTISALRENGPRLDQAWEIVVVDDGSTDGTAEFLQDEAANRHAGRPVLKVVAPGQNLGRARARNLGARNAEGRWILFLDDDIVVPRGLIEAHLELLGEHPGYGTIGYATTDPSIVDAPHFHYLDTRGVAKLPPGPAPARFFVTQNAAVPRREFLAIGGFDEEFSAYGFEDMEVAFRLEDEADVRFRALVSPVPVHVHHHTLQEYLEKKRECGRKSLPSLARRHPHRIREMRLEYAVDPAGDRVTDLAVRAFRALADSPLGKSFPEWMGHWPQREDCRPRVPGLYCRLMNLAILCCYRQGVTESPAESAK